MIALTPKDFPDVSEEEAYDVIVKHWNRLFEPDFRSKLDLIHNALQGFQEVYKDATGPYEEDGLMMDINVREEIVRNFIHHMDIMKYFPKPDDEEKRTQ